MTTKKLTDLELKEIKEIVSEKDCVDDLEMEDLIKLKTTISNNNIALAILYTKCFTLLDINMLKFKTDDEDYSEKLKDYIYQFDLPELRHLVNEYENGEGFGDYVIAQNIKKCVYDNKRSCMEVIRIFWALFGGED